MPCIAPNFLSRNLSALLFLIFLATEVTTGPTMPATPFVTVFTIGSISSTLAVTLATLAIFSALKCSFSELSRSSTKSWDGLGKCHKLGGIFFDGIFLVYFRHAQSHVFREVIVDHCRYILSRIVVLDHCAHKLLCF